MTIRYPLYYENFHCIADRCEDTCCAGWEIDIDDRSYQYYNSVTGEMGKRLKNSIREYGLEQEDAYEAHGFVLDKDRRCPFLNDEGLCDLFLELGEGSLCDVCTNTPRNFMEYGREREISISASCPEAARLIYGKKEPIVFVEREEEGELDFEESPEEIMFAHRIRDARDQSVKILQDRKYTVTARIAHFLKFAGAVQSCLNANEPDKIESIPVEQYWVQAVSGGPKETKYRLFLSRMCSFTKLDSIREDWNEILRIMQKRYITKENGASVYAADMAAWQHYLTEEGREYEYEHFLVYYAYLCLARCVDDYDFLGKAKLCIVNYLMIRDMDMACYGENGGYSVDERLHMVRLYAKEIEHSEENLDFLAEEFLFEDAYDVENLIVSL